ncbi:MAG: tetratricopeptide repeat protein [Prolixibacteraceae bacterium]|nr:tetratricopeptide repeat protein [Prolixibacteraceae bacterium]MBN2774671.1 tetratricopeptide repeat protein [Prolixibacteraceae bacterium]
MIRKVEYTERIDCYLNNEFDPQQKKEFEAELASNTELAEELKLQVEIQDALAEKDVMNLRKNLNTILNSGQAKEEKLQASFDLVEDLEEFNEFEAQVDPDELLNYYESLPKLHIYQHEIASRENVHHFYKEQELTKAKVEEEEVFTDEALMAEIEEAIMEKDVLQLRDNLKQIAQSMPDHDYSHEEIDEYLDNIMPDSLMAEFEKELVNNARLAKDVELHRELEKAVVEKDIMDLRANINNIMETQTSYNQDFVDIEKYLENDLTEEQLAEFENDMYENSDLKADVSLHKEVDLASAESDVMSLRDNLRNIRAEINTREEKSVIRLNTGVKSVFIRYSAAVVVLIAFGLSIFTRLQPADNEHLYSKYVYNTEAPGTQRGSDNSFDRTLSAGQELFNLKHYEEAVMAFQTVIERNKNNSISQFFLAKSYQNMRESLNAIKEFEKVAGNSETTYKDLAEYNIGLCYLVLDDRKKAAEQFRNLIRNNNFYRDDAKAILRELKLEDKE